MDSFFYPVLLPLLVVFAPPLFFSIWWDRFGSRQAKLRKLELDGWIYLYPAALILGVFHLLPVGYALAISFFEPEAGEPFHQYVGLANFRRLLGDFLDPRMWWTGICDLASTLSYQFHVWGQELSGSVPSNLAESAPNLTFHPGDVVFWKALSNTAWYAVFTVILSIAVALAAALLLNQKLRGLGAYRTIYFLPVVTSVAAVSLVWKLIFHPQRGLANEVLSWFGFGPLGWLQEGRGVFRMALEWISAVPYPGWLPEGPSLALVSVAIMSVWKVFGYNVVLFLAGLQNIPEELYEAATIDGASSWDKFRHITWPLLSPTTFFVLVMSTISSFQVFAQIFMLYQGNATETSRVIVYYLYEKAFQTFELGYASAIAFALFVILFLMTMFQRRVVGSKVHYSNAPG